MLLLRNALDALTVADLKKLLSHFPGPTATGRKELLVTALFEQLDQLQLESLWLRLDPLQRRAVVEAVHAPDGHFNPHTFLAKYGSEPAFFGESRSRYGSHRGEPTALWLFLYSGPDGLFVPADMREHLRRFLPLPPQNRLALADSLPRDDPDMLLLVRETENEAIADLAQMLQLADQGRIAASNKTGLPSRAATQLLHAQLAGGDYYGPAPGKKAPDLQEIGALKAVSWPLLLQAGGLATAGTGKLSLTPAGMKAAGKAAALTLRGLWRDWLKYPDFDEFSRIDDIKGQSSKDARMTPVQQRRAVIAGALQRCPTGQWIATAELSRYMQAEDLRFEVCHDAWSLYLQDRDYGSLGYDGSSRWDMLQLRYLLCFLFEYCAPLGMVDVAFIDPAGARPDFKERWGADEMAFLSRYDGLMYFRITPLGAYCLGTVSEYAAARGAARLVSTASLQISVADGELTPAEAVLLDNWAEREEHNVWRLSLVKGVRSVERGHDIAQLEALLTERDSQPLPPQVEHFLRTCGRQGRALEVLGTALLIACADAATADMVAAHKRLARLCQRSGERHLVVRIEHEKEFRKGLGELGFGMPKPGD